MSFASFAFAGFLAAQLLAMAIVRGQQGRRLVLLAAGVIFYGWWDYRFVALVGFTSVFDFFMGLAIGAATGARKKRLLALDVTVNLGILAVFKYLNFFIESANAALSPLGLHLQTLEIILPVGISFFVFEAMSYCIDIYRGKLEPYRDWLQFALFIFFFPRMIAGPIIRPADFLPQVRDRHIGVTAANAHRAASLFALGLAKKVLVADRVALLVDPVFAHPAAFDSVTVWAAVFAYAIQIFCDFSGYTDMAIGLARLFGFDLPLNFNLPYLSSSITEFWRRWHISLSSWLRDYLYISLGGNRGGPRRTYWNLMLTMLLGGLWHGASWNFVVWGGLHGAALGVHKAVGVKEEQDKSAAWRVFATVGTFLLVCFCWVFFRAKDFGTSWTVLGKMLFVGGPGVRFVYAPFVPIAVLVVAWHLLRRSKNEHFTVDALSFPGMLLLMSLATAVYFAAPLQSQPFIYFQF